MAAIDTTAPGHPTDFQAYGSDGEVVLEWTNPTDIDFKETVVLRKSAGGWPADHTDGTEVYRGDETEYTDTDVSNGQEYAYGAFAFDGSN